jgi:hypothetical protein
MPSGYPVQTRRQVVELALSGTRSRRLGRDLRHERGDDLWLVTCRRCRGTAARLPAVPLRSRVPGTSENSRPRTPSFAAFAPVRRSLTGSEPVTFHRGDSVWFQHIGDRCVRT